MKNLCFPAVLALAYSFTIQTTQAQAVTEIVTDYNGYWRSSATVANATRPENSHHLLAFTFGGVRYATGVNDAVLSAQGLSFVPGDYQALGVSNMAAAGTSTRLALGASWDGVPNGASNPVPSRVLAPYLTDGIKGLNIGTGVANLPAGSLVFGVNSLQPSAIGDGVPDILITQIADPSGGTDSYQFVNSSNGTVGNSVSVSFASIDSVGGWIGDFYNAYANPVTLASSETRASKPMRLWAADFSAFGITSANAGSITALRINLNGNSDMAFIAYNNAVVTILPLTLKLFRAEADGNGVNLHWQLTPDSDLAYTDVQAGTNATNLNTITKIAGNIGTTTQDYHYYHNKPNDSVRFYRLKLVGIDGTHKYSHIIKIGNAAEKDAVAVWPNPTNGVLKVAHAADAEGVLQVVNAAGITVLHKRIAGTNGITELNTGSLPPGVYRVVVPGKSIGKVFVKL